MDLYLFDFDKTLYGYDFRKRLPALAELIGSSQYHLAKTWWGGGHEEKADQGGYPTTESYLEAWHEVTGTVLTLEVWRESRMAAMTRSDSAVAALKRASELGAVSLLSNNNVLFRDFLPVVAPEVAEILGENNLVSADLGATKPDPRIFEVALKRLNASPDSTFFADDNSHNVAAANQVGITGYQVPLINAVPDGASMLQAIEAFANRG